MPTSKEVVSNKALSGAELSTIILADATRLLADHGLLSGQMAFSRVAYELRLTLHLDLPSMPSATDSVRSSPRSTNDVAHSPSLAAIEAVPPLASPSDSAIFTSDELHRTIASPNVARLEHSLPIDVSVRDQDGHTVTRQVSYPADYPGMDPVPATIADVTDVTRAELKMPTEPLPPMDIDAAAPVVDAEAEGMCSDDLRT